MATALPDHVTALVAALGTAGHRTVVVGGCLRDLHLGREVHDWDLATAARPEAVLEVFPRAIPIGLRHGTVMVPTPAGPVDVTSFRGDGSLEGDLAHRDFTMNAMALEPGRASGAARGPEGARWIDPHDGRGDLAAGVLRAVGDAGARLAEDPLRALRAARFVAELGLEPDPDLAAALSRATLAGVARERIRTELVRLLCAPRAGRALRLLRETGLEASLAEGVREDAAAVVDRVAPILADRLTAWLRDASADRTLRRLRFPSDLARDVAARLAAHPADRWSLGLATLRRRHRRLGDAGLDAMVALRRAECAAGSLGAEETARVETALARLAERLADLRARGTLSLERAELAVGGAEVMAWLGCRPGPAVGRALRWLTERVAEDPERNRPELLRELLAGWRDEEAPR